jgi:hypothetical protein
MDDNDRSLDASPSPWSAPPTAKERGAVQRAVGRLLDELAPERAPARGGHLAGTIERHRTPTGCVLQAPAAAVSVSWFADAANDAALGELRVIVWRGVVTRRGAGRSSEGAAVVRELTLRPVERSGDEWGWRADDGSLYHGGALAELCLALLDEQIGPTRAGDLPS